MDVDQIKQRVQSLLSDSDLSILHSKEEFEKSQSKSDNPLLINEEVNYQKEIFSKLKFQYLEQETRDKFLRRISESTTENINRQDVNEMEKETSERKKQLKHLKTELYSKIGSLEEISNENIALNLEFQEKLSDTNNYINEIEHMEKEIDALMKEQQNETKELIDNVELEGDVDLDQLKSSNQKSLLAEESRLSEMNIELHQKNAIQRENLRSLDEMKNKLSQLEATAEIVEPNEKPNRAQAFAKWCKDMNEILFKFTNLDSIHLSWKNSPDSNLQEFQLELSKNNIFLEIVFNNEFKIMSYSGSHYDAFMALNEKAITDSDSFIEELAKIINTVICE